MAAKRKLTVEQLEQVAADKAANEWWQRDGRYYDPDTDDVDWYDKRVELAKVAFLAGRKSASEASR